MAALLRPPGPAAGFFSGGLVRFRRDPLTYLERVQADYGSFAYFQAGHQHIYYVNEPELIREVLVTRSGLFTKSRILQRAKSLLGEGLLTNEGTSHLRQRRMVQPAFYRDHLVTYGAQMVALADKACHRWRNEAKLDIDQEMMRLTLAIVGQTLFSADVEDEAPQVGEAMNALIAIMPLLMLPGSQFIEYVPLPVTRRYLKAAKLVEATIFRIMNERRASAGNPDDLLSMLMNARDPEGDDHAMSDKQVRDEALTLFLAGHETTATALAWTWYLLAQHLDAEAALHAELAHVLGDRLPTFDDLPRLRYTQQIFAESMRLYPPAWAIGRMAREPLELGGYTLPAKSIVLLSPYLMHRNPRFWPDPDRFDPARWADGDFYKRDFTYFPFGGGPRICVGERFAWMEGALLLAVIAQRWRFRLEPGHRVERKALITLRAKNGIKVIAQAR
ncbi:MAG: cytochrome P450 [Acidobacteriota bacterium]|jgi:cytochrome P450|nr:cytochrome P450 [Bryobacteraceae bacterium CoA2 C42]MCA2963234.1 cytochrome P450 [Acidobacteriaceae bacterium]